MKTNLFNVKEKKEKKIIIEEEKLKNPFLLFLKRHKNFIFTSGIMLGVCLLLVSTGIAFSLFRGTNDYDISYIEGDETIDSNNNPEIGDEEVEEELLGEIARSEGIVLQTNTFMTQDGDVVSYFTDGTAVVVRANGKIYRISTNKQETYGIDKNGVIDESAKKILVTSTTTTLTDGSIITYYSDGTAKVEHKGQTFFVRDSNNVKITDGNTLEKLEPSGVAPTKENIRISNSNVKKFTDKTSLITINNAMYIVNKNTEVTTMDTEINYDKQNIFDIISEKKYDDGNIITYFSNGSAIITDPLGNVTFVKKSGDIEEKKQKLYEIIPNEKGYSTKTFNIAGNKKVTYFDNGVAIIENHGGERQYVEDSDDIVYGNNKSISSQFSFSKQISEKTTTDGDKVYNFENGKSQVIEPSGESYIIDTDKLVFDTEGNIEEEKPEENTPPKEDPGEGIYVSDAENTYNDFYNVEDTKFIIKNKNNKSKILRITIEEVSNYKKYNTDRLPPQYVKFQATIGDKYIPATTLTENTWKDSEGKINYIIYEGTIGAKETQEVALSLYVNYAPLDNSYQNKGFIGTIRIYVEDGTK